MYEDEKKEVIEEIQREVEVVKAQGKKVIFFVRYILESDREIAIAELVSAFPEMKGVDLYTDELSDIDTTEDAMYLVYNCDKKLNKLDDFFRKAFDSPFRASVIFLVSADDTKFFVKTNSFLWARKTGFFGWPKKKKERDLQNFFAGGDDLAPSTVEELMKLLNEEPEKIDDFIKGRIFNVTINILRLKKYEEARKILIKLISALKMKDDVQSIATAYLLLGNIAFETNDYHTAIDWYNEASSFIEKLNDDTKLSDLYHQRGYIYFLLSDYKKALEDFQRAMAIDEAGDDKFKKSLVFRRVAITLEQMGKIDEAEALYKKSLELEEEMQNEAGISRIYQHLGRIYEKKEKHDKAFEYYKKSLEVKKKLKDERGLASLYHQLGNFEFNRENFEEALKNYRKSLAIDEKLNDFQSSARTLIQIGLCQEELGRYNDSLKTLKQARNLLSKLQSPLVNKVKELISEVSEKLDSKMGDSGRKEREKSPQEQKENEIFIDFEE